MAGKKKTRQSSVAGGTNYKVLRSLWSPELDRQLHRGEVVSLTEDSNIRNAVKLGYLSTTNEQPPEPKPEGEGEEGENPEE
jgi:hypothetical protein